MRKIILLALPVLVILASCNSTQVTTSWRDNKSNVSSISNFQKVLVLGLLSNKNRAVKDRMEAQLAGTLKQYGVNAVAASNIYEPKTFDNMTEAEALQKLQNDGIDAVITFALVDKNTSHSYVPGAYGWGPGFWGYYHAWRWGGYGWDWGAPGYVTNNTKYIFETNLYDVTSNNKMIYSAHSESFDPNSSADLAVGYSNSLIKDFQKQGLLAGKR